MMLRGWRARRPSRRTLERRAEMAQRRAVDADSRAATAVRANVSLRDQQAVAERRCEDARARAAAAERAAVVHADTISQARAVLDGVPFDADLDQWRQVGDELRQVLNGRVSDGD